MTTGFLTVETQGGLLPGSFLQRLAREAAGRGRRGGALPGLAPEAYHLLGNERLGEAVQLGWNRLQGAWTA